MHLLSSGRYWLGGLLAAVFTLLVASVYITPSVADLAARAIPSPIAMLAVPPTNTVPPVPPTSAPTDTAVVPPTVAADQATPTDIIVSAAPITETAEPQALPPVDDSGAIIVPTPTPRAPGTPLHVGLQAGHWKSNELPDDLARLRTSTGAYSNGLSELNVNLDITQRVAKLLEQVGIVVDVLPATVPLSYDADAFVAIHADGVQTSGPRGFKLATPWRFSPASLHLLNTVTQEYAQATGMPQDSAITFNMRGYYAFQWRRHPNAVARTTPAIIIETGFITNPTDRRILTTDQDTVAVGIANGIIRYLNERDPNDGAALVTPDYAVQRAISPDGVDIRASPRDDARVLLRVGQDKQIVPLYQSNGWYQVVVPGQWRQIGWVRKDQVQQSSGPTPTPLPATDS